jgi:uncharacterized peroxidase-related enzyme
MTTDTARLSVPLLTAETAEPAAAAQMRETQAKLGFVPNMYGQMAHLPALLATYLSGYDAFRKEAGFTPAEQETVFLAVSGVTGCAYCTAAHSMLAEKMSRVPADSIAALRAGTPLPDAKLNALAAFTRAMMASHGQPSAAEVAAFLAAGYTPRHAFGVILAIGVKTFSNYTNRLTGTPLDGVFAGHAVAA